MKFKFVTTKNAIEIIMVLIIVFSVINYRIINKDTDKYILTSEVNVSNEENVDYDGNHIIDGDSPCIYHIGSPKTEIKYSESFDGLVYRYIIPFYAKNVSQEDTAEVTIDQTIRVYSAGNVWDSLARKDLDPENDLNDETKWVLNPGETGKGYAIVDVVIDEMHTEKDLSSFEIYSVSRLDDRIYKYKINFH